MRVLIATKGYFNTNKIVKNFALDQAIALSKLGVDVRIMCLDFRTLLKSNCIGYKKWQIKGILVFGIAIPMRVFPFFVKVFAANSLFPVLFRRVTKDGWYPDIIHTHFVAHAINKTIRQASSKLIVTEHYSGLNTVTPNKVLLKETMKAYSEASALIAVSHNFARRLKEITGFDFCVLPNILDSTVFFGPIKENDIKPSENCIRMVSAGDFTKNKDHAKLIEIMYCLKNYNIELHIFGSGKERNKIDKLIKDRNLCNCVFIHGYVDRSELISFYKRSDLFVLLSKSETFGVAYIEALACGLPVVSLECGGTDDFINKTNGIIISKNSRIDQIKNEILKMINSIDSYDRLSISQDTFIQYNYKAIIPQLIEIYKKALE